MYKIPTCWLQNIQNAIGTYKKTFVYFSINAKWTRFAIFCCALFHHTDWFVQERRKSIADALGLNFSGTNPSKYDSSVLSFLTDRCDLFTHML